MLKRRLILLLLAAVAIPALAQGSPDDGPDGGGPPPNMRGVRGAVTAISGSTVTIKTDEGDSYQVLTSENTRIMKQRMPAEGGPPAGGRPQGGANRGPGDRQPIKISDIHLGDTVMAGGELNPKAHTVGAVFVAVIDAEDAKKMRENLGKTWTAGEVTAIKDTTITIKRIDNASQSFSVDENTSFRKRRDSITLADIQVGDRLTAQGALKDGVFTATTVNVGRAQGGPGGEGRWQGRGQGNAPAASGQDTNTPGASAPPHNP
jgi:hypothetical protein